MKHEAHSTRRVSLYDATLRDGMQGAGINFSESGKMRFAHLLDEFGIDFIEGGFAGSTPGSRRFFEQARREHFSHSKIVAFGSTRRAHIAVEEDSQLNELLQAETEHVAIFGKSSLFHVTDVLGVSAEMNLQMIEDSVAFLAEHGRKVFFDAEQFFDGYKQDAAYAVRTLEIAQSAGAIGLVLCDTNGGCLPHEIFETVQTVVAKFPQTCIAIHTHNDSGMAVACSIEAVRAGASQVQGCVNGYGERTGNADLISIIPALELKMGLPCIGDGQLKNLREISIVADDLANLRPDPSAPYVGRDAFCHKAGTHANAVMKNPKTFEHVAPESVGNQRQFVLSDQSGGAIVRQKAKELGFDVSESDPKLIRSVLKEIKQRELDGYAYEAADGSFKILLQKMMKRHTPAFELDGFRVIVEKRGRDEPCISEATIKVRVNGKEELTAGEGHGPVDALNEAMRKALTHFYPEIEQVQLTDFRVRILDPQDATRAQTRVVIESSDGMRQWGTVGVSENIIEASWQALLDSVEYKLLDDLHQQNRESVATNT